MSFNFEFFNFMQISSGIRKRACRYLLQHYLGRFLETKLGLDQLSVDLYKGTGSVKDVRLDVDVSRSFCFCFHCELWCGVPVFFKTIPAHSEVTIWRFIFWFKINP